VFSLSGALRKVKYHAAKFGIETANPARHFRYAAISRIIQGEHRKPKHKEKNMAYDPEARENSNSAMIIAIVAVVLVVLGGLAWYATQGNNPPDTVAPVVTHTETIKEVPVDNSAAPDTVIVNPAPTPAPAPAPSTSTTTNVTVKPTAPAPNPAPAPASKSETNVTVNPPSEKPAAPPAGDAKSADNSAGY
jgi:cytoskeletal protein RodZ